jgi:hypothetical protein
VSLEGYASFFEDLDSAFPPDYSRMPLARGAGPSRSPAAKAHLVVRDVGMFEASFVPTRADFARLDPRFRMPEGVWDQLPGYADWGFAVFRLKPKARGVFRSSAREPIHPMALTFPRRDETTLFFPTTHVHDGTAPAKASFDHMLFCQADGVLGATLDWTKSTAPLGDFLDRTKVGTLVDVTKGGLRQSIWGELHNHDVTLTPPAGVTVSDLAGRGEAYAYVLRAGSAYAIDLEAADEMRRAWTKTARERLPALASVVREGLRTLSESRKKEWALAALSEDLAPHFVNGTQLWTGTDYMNGTVAVPGGRGRVAMRIFTKRVEPQDITLAFERLPDQGTLDRIRAELAGLLDGAAS